MPEDNDADLGREAEEDEGKKGRKAPRAGKPLTIPDQYWPFIQAIPPIPGSKEAPNRALIKALVRSWYPFDKRREIEETWMAFFSQAYKAGLDVYSMWTHDWGEVGETYRTQLARQEAESSSEVRRIIAHRPLGEILNFIKLTLGSFNRKSRPAYFELDVPKFSVPTGETDIRTEKSIFLSDDVCPPVEIVVRRGEREWKTYATLTFQDKKDKQLYLLTTGSQSLCEDLLLDVWRAFAKRCTTLSDWDEVWRWLIDVDRVTRGFTILREDDGERRPQSVQRLYETSEALFAELGEFNWDRIAKDYDDVVRNPDPKKGHPFFRSYFDAEDRIVVSELERYAAESTQPISLVDFGCGGGGLMDRINQEIGPAARHRPKTGDIPGLLGIDSSHEMLKRAHLKLSRNGKATRLPSFEFPCDLRELEDFMRDGSIVGPNPRPQQGIDVPDRTFIRAFNESRHFAWSANVIPNIRKSSRAQFIQGLYAALGPGDRLLLTTYDGTQFGDGGKVGFAGDVYRHTEGLTGLLKSGGAFFPSDRLYVNSTSRFFSYWPTLEELAEILSAAPFTQIRPGVSPSRADSQGRVAFVVGTKPGTRRHRVVGGTKIERQ